MFTYYWGQTRLTYNQAVSKNKDEKINIYCEISNAIILKSNSNFDIVSKVLCKHFSLWEYVIIPFDINIWRLKYKYKKFLWMFWKISTGRIPIWKIWDNKGMELEDIWFTDEDINDVNKDTLLRDWEKVETALFQKETINSKKEYRTVDALNDTLSLEDCSNYIKDPLLFEIEKLIVDLNYYRTVNLSWTKYNFLQKLIPDKVQLDWFLKTKWFEFKNDTTFQTLTVELYWWEKNIIFWSDKVEHIKYWERDISTILFYEWLFPVWYCTTNYDFNQKRIMDYERTYYVMKNNYTWELKYLSEEIDRKNFNRVYMKQWLSYRWEEIDLLDFFDALKKLKQDWDIKQYDVIYKNWFNFEKNMFIHWWKDYLHNNKNTIIVATPYNTVIRKNIDVINMYNMLIETYNERAMTLAYLWYLWAMMASYWKSLNIKVPLLLINWESQAGKSKMIEMFMNMFEFDTKNSARIMSAKWLTEQPFLAAARDEIPLMLDEFTGEVNKWVEWSIRSFYDNTQTKKWRPWGNEVFEINSPLMLCWERSPQFGSVINRWVFLVLQKSYKKWKPEQIENILKHSIVENFFERIQDINPEIFKRTAFDFTDDRLADTYNWIIYVNRIFKLVDEQILIEYINYAASEQLKYINAFDEKTDALITLILENMKAKTIVAAIKNGSLEVELFVNVLRDKNQLTRLFIQLNNELSWENVDNLVSVKINLDKLLEDWKKEIFNILIKLLSKYRDVAIDNWIDAKISSLKKEEIWKN